MRYTVGSIGLQRLRHSAFDIPGHSVPASHLASNSCLIGLEAGQQVAVLVALCLPSLVGTLPSDGRGAGEAGEAAGAAGAKNSCPSGDALALACLFLE